ncbi:uncharacterized protein I303_101494 [Kwoniella dejecticola CBS 10117]|uniref:Esterase n=1 Tax=Kwoniella dejecticola CBS 10117 TaxID=1296121 RepID=A0A1A6ADP3_9TREE|nr:esterase [Kwoniella dejecticola CBS 10117]OBR88153.1 esterase [Kwoniella dejecticola CBS 10117]
MATKQLHSAQPLPVKHLLKNFTSEYPLRAPSPIPPSSRVDPSLTQRLPPPTSSNPFTWTLPTWWLFIRFLLTKGLHVYFNLLSHFIFGPKRKSWGYRMTFITSFMRNIADHSSLADIVLVRRFISLHFLVPLPGDAVVTPITFKVPLKKGKEIARGFLGYLDKEEDGQRELSGEWVVGTDVWKRLKAERRARNRSRNNTTKTKRKSSSTSSRSTTPIKHSGLINSLPPTSETHSFQSASSPSTTSHPKSNINPFVPSSSSSNPINGSHPSPSPQRTNRSNSTNSTTTPTTDSESDRTGERVIYYVHGGAYYVGNAATHRLITIGVSKSCNARVFAITYRLAPEHVFPLPLHDVLHGYLRLLAPPLSIPPENIIIAGDSAGGGLSLALCMYLRDEGYKLPAGLVLMSPWVDLTMSCGSWDENAATDVVPRPEADDHLNPVACYLGPKGITSYLTHPYASPLFGDLSGLPPMLIQSGDSEVLRDEITLLAHKATLAGVHVTHELYEDMVHVFQMFSFLPATTAAINNVGKWVCQTLPAIEEEEVLGRLNKEVEAEMETSPRVVSGDGDELGVANTSNQTEVIPSEIDAAQDYRASRLRTPKASALALDIGEPQGAGNTLDDNGPTVDLDSLPADVQSKDIGTNVQGSTSRSRSRSRSITPTPKSRTPFQASASELGLDLSGIPFPQSNHALPFDGPHTLPRLRRSITNVPSSQQAHSHNHGISPLSPTPSSTSATNYFGTQHHTHNHGHSRRRTTYSLHVSPAQSTGARTPSNPTSPTPSIRKRLRGMSISSSAHGTPSTRARSKSHSDIFELVEGYVEGGAANTTTVIDPEGEVRSMGVLGEDEDDLQ